MAGEGGFSTQVGGFNRNEVNEYISKMGKEKQKLEQDLKASEEKLKAAVKIASESDEKIKAAQEECRKQIDELNAQLKTERKKSEELVLQIDDLKRKLKNSGSSKAAAGDPNAAKRADEIISAANAKAKEIIANAQREASSSVSAKGTAVDGEALMAAIKAFRDTVTGEIQKLSSKASQILNTPAPSMTAASAPAQNDFMSMGGGFFEDMDSDNGASAPAFDDMGGFADMNTDFGSESADMTTPNAASGGDMTDMGASADDMDVAPLEPDNSQNQSMDDFGKELLEQTIPSSSLNDAMQDMFTASGSFEISSGGSDDAVSFDMGSGDSAQSDIDAMNALLGQMSAGLEGAGGMESMDVSDSMDKPEESAPADDNPWANLQAQLDAMEKSGDFGSDDSGNDAGPAITSDSAQAPSADDSSIWNFGSDSSSSDDMSDDMSADLFGSF